MAAKQKALKVESWPIDKFVFYARNPRKNDHAVDNIAAAIREFGFRVPIIAKSDGTVVDGHLRLKAAKKLGMSEVPVVLADDLTDAQIKAFRISVNKMADLADWDTELLALEFSDLSALDFDLTLTGFGEGELADIMVDKTAGLTDPDDVPPVPEQPVTVAGDTWLLGKHRLRCGDSTSADDVAALLNGVEPHLMVTDPPYGVEYDADWRNRADRANGKPYGARAVGVVSNDDRADWREAWALFPGDVAYVWHAGVHSPTVAESLAVGGFEMRALICWAKSSLVIGRGHYHHMHEPCWYAVKKGGTGHWAGDRKQTTLWQIDKPMKSETGHSTQKPVECMRRPIVNNSSPGQAVYEPFSGSGTTIIAGEMEGRAIYSMEIAENYCDVAVQRWQAFTGQDATLESTGETFNAKGEQCKAA